RSHFRLKSGEILRLEWRRSRHSGGGRGTLKLRAARFWGLSKGDLEMR
ncbi:unnamed protein product, partial [Brassica rapa subsp. trilocularis]